MKTVDTAEVEKPTRVRRYHETIVQAACDAYYEQGESIAKIAKYLGAPVNTVKGWVFRDYRLTQRTI